MTQGIILLGGIATIILISRVDNRLKIGGFLLGALMEPFWLWDAWQDQDWGIFILCFVYTWAYIDGAWKHAKENGIRS